MSAFSIENRRCVVCDRYFPALQMTDFYCSRRCAGVEDDAPRRNAKEVPIGETAEWRRRAEENARKLSSRPDAVRVKS